ncbi:hypothetical protein ISN76_05995 [Dyella halodurans]|uniref:DUF3761 domain-containing protein n=1 Tax=Dyella halodurans TaxID=1920171 RepID=A0ABV9C4B6_9GAMM|nr:hypothetical protein [Dyella halodurans]
MKIIRTTGLLAACLLTTAAWAQSAGQPLNLKLPANVPAASASAAPPATVADAKSTASAGTAGSATAPASTPPSAYAKDPPGTYYGDTSGAMGDAPAPARQNVVTCDDATYNQPQIHGAVSTGVVASSHGSGNWQSGGVTISQATGSCEHPTGGMSISVGGSTGHYGH